MKTITKTITLMLMLTSLTACEPGKSHATSQTPFNTGLQSNEEISDCKAYKVYDDNPCDCHYVVMIRCPNSSVTTQTVGKHQTTTLTTSN